ncbi:RDD family protein [Halalkalibacter urbisdiaboli]|uniref:RDD family protein n=1 Tax=Halalkalibacter urbisdiaboli TaxID=1960589 RepID=UPI000B439C7E|nr:RDD family protein [Halalkalibacter urbisdiaboli]
MLQSNKIRIVNGKLRGRIERIETCKHEQYDNQAVELSMPVAGFWMRFWAFLIDLIAVFSLKGILVYPLLRLTGTQHVSIGPLSLEMMLAAIVFFLYFAIMTKYYSQTIGKMVFGLRVVSYSGSKLSWQQILFREAVGRILHQAFALLYLLYITVAFTEKKQGIHDMIAESYVIHEAK